MIDRSPVPSEFTSQPEAATDKQLAYIATLLQERELPTAAARAELETRLANAFACTQPGISKSRASDFIRRLLALPRREKIILRTPSSHSEFAVDYTVIPDGRYALKMDGDELNPVHFYKVNHGKPGSRWEGFAFVDRFSSDETYPVKGAAKYEVLTRIMSNPRAAAVLYGHESNHCCLCGRKLTRVESRKAGIGPICSARAGW